ncbi:MAG: outer membrane protein assembly factor BamD [Planctomycetes bacterium]|nr:outer membrane protein assembly factor BamD [Planctomycetota bacterium]
MTIVRPRSASRHTLTPAILLAGVFSCALALTSHAQISEYKLGEDGQPIKTREAAPDTDEAFIDSARALLAENRASECLKLIDPWIEKYEFSANPWLPEAYLIRGDAKVALNDEYEALYDYEKIIKDYTAAPQFPLALDREYAIARKYVRGMKKKWWFGWRVEDARILGEEMLIRVNERMPSSVLAEKSMMELADFYYRERDLKLAAEAYDIFLTNFPQSDLRERAMQQRVYSYIARFKGPEYDASGLIEAKALIGQYSGKYPVEAEQAGLSDALVARIDESAAAQMYETASWYLKKDDPVSARLTLKRLIQAHPGTVAATKAVEDMLARGWLKAPQADAPPADTASAPASPTQGSTK